MGDSWEDEDDEWDVDDAALESLGKKTTVEPPVAPGGGDSWEDEDVVTEEELRAAQREREELAKRDAERKAKQERENIKRRKAEEAKLLKNGNNQREIDQQAVEDADNALCDDLFSTSISGSGGGGGVMAKDLGDHTMEELIGAVTVKKFEEHEELARLLVQKLTSKELNLTHFLKELLRGVCPKLKKEKLDEVAAVITVLQTEKLGKKKFITKPKAPVKTKAQNQKEKKAKAEKSKWAEDTFGSAVGGDQYDEYDFM